jgi:hypothetical protein
MQGTLDAQRLRWLLGVRQKVWRVFLALIIAIGGWGATLAPQAAHAVAMTALINDDTVSGGSFSLEATKAVALGFTVTDVSGATWDTMTAAQFASYQVLIAGDPTCGPVATSFTSNAAVWAPVVMGTSVNTQPGNRVLIGTDPIFHGRVPDSLVKNGIAFAGNIVGRTGLYFDATCDGYNPNPAVVPTLEMLSAGSGAWTEDLVPPCGGNVSLIASNPAFSTLTTADLQGWGCSVHESFPTFRSDWSPLAVATDTVSHPTCGTDPNTGLTACGEAYILIAGAGTVVTSNAIHVTPATATNPAGPTHSHTVTACVSSGPNCTGTPTVGQLVVFTITGQNAGVVGTCVPASCMTDATGHVTFTYFDLNGAGTDTIIASFTAGGTTQSATASKVWVLADTTPPTCVLKSKTASGIVIAVQDTGSGLAATTGGTFTAPSPAGGIQVTSAVNSSVTVPAVASGTTTEVDVTATKINGTLGSSVGLRVTDVAGNVTVCDPTLVADSSGRPTGVTIDGSEGHLLISNNGLNSLTIEVNGKAFNLRSISGKTDLTLDISSALHAGSNSVTIHGRGPHGSNAVIVFSS